MLSACAPASSPPAAEPAVARAASLEAAALPATANLPPMTADVVAHRERARSLLEEHCGACHVPDDHGQALALHIYDLSQPDWSGTLSDAQLPVLQQKLLDDGANADERLVLERFVQDELAWRDAHPALYPRAFRERPPRGR